MEMPIGKFKGQPVETMSTQYLAWLVSNEHIRYNRWPLVEHIIAVLCTRFSDPQAVAEELRVAEPPAQFWKTERREARIARERIVKMQILELEREADLFRARAAFFRKKAMGVSIIRTDVSDLI